MTYEQIEIIVRCLGVLVALFITFVIKPLIDSKVSATEQEKLFKYIKKGVECANQIFDPEQCQEKKAYVLDYISDILEKNVHLELSYKEIDILVEGFVKEVKKGLN